MKPYIFHTPTGWKWNKFPDKPTYATSHENANDKLIAYEKQVAELKASALIVANPEIIPTDDLRINLGYEFYEWPGEVEIEEYSDENRIHFKQAVLSLPKPEADLT